MPGAPDPFCIGSNTWPGLSKFVEELGENGQVAGKIIAFPHLERWQSHPDGEPLHIRLESEIGDLLAIIDYLVEHNDLNWLVINRRKQDKMDRFERWDREERERRGEAPGPES